MSGNNLKRKSHNQPHAEIIKEICEKIECDKILDAKNILKNKWEHKKLKNNGRQYTVNQKTQIFWRDGFIDRYSGEKLVYPPVLKVLSMKMEEEFPYHKHWKMADTHIAWWELIPTIDHVEPIARGGLDNEENWVCTSQLRNSAKSNWTLEELGWKKYNKGDPKKWDGLIGWFMEYMENAPKEIKDDPYIKKWYKAAIKLQKYSSHNCYLK